MKISLKNLEKCVEFLGYKSGDDNMIEIVKMYLKTNFHPIFQLTPTVKRRLAKFLKKRDKSFMPLIERSNNDVCLLHQLRSLYSKPATIADGGGGREKSRINDIYWELELVKQRLSQSANFNYLDLGCSEGKITKAIISALSLNRDQAFACDIFDQKPDPEFTFSLNTVSTLPYADNQFDFITLFMSAHHFSHVDDIFKEIRRVIKPDGYILIREHDCNSKDDSTFYNILHALYASVLGSEMTPFGFVKIFTDCEKAIYTDNKFIFNVYAQYRSITDWISLFEQYGFESLDSYGDPGIFAHGFYDQRSDTYFVDQMDSFYQLFKAKK